MLVCATVFCDPLPPTLQPSFAFYLTQRLQQRTVLKLQQNQQQSLWYKDWWTEGTKPEISGLFGFNCLSFPPSSLLCSLSIFLYWLSLSFKAVSRKQKQHKRRWDVFICACQTAVHTLWVWQVGHFQTNRGYSARLSLNKTSECWWEKEIITIYTQNNRLLLLAFTYHCSCLFLMHTARL